MSSELLFLLGGVVVIGFLGNAFFERTGIPDILLLLGIGLLLGPVFNVVSPDKARPFMSAFGTIAFTIILFEGGLDLDLRDTIRQSGRALLLVVFSFGLTIFLLYYALVVGLGASGKTAWAVAAALACTSSPIVIPVLRKLAPDSPMRPLLAVESALSDALAVMTVLAIIGRGNGDISGASLLGTLGMSFLIGGGAAIVSGICWLWLLSHLYNRRFFYLVTVGFVFLLMGTVEAFHGSGAFAVFLFGIILANGERLLGVFGSRLRERARQLFADGHVALHPRISDSHAEISFLIRSFFFVYLGIIFRWPGDDMRMWLTIPIVGFSIVVGREIAVRLAAWTTRIPPGERGLLKIMIPRGFATAVLAAILMSRAEENSPSWDTLATFIVLISNLWMTLRLPRAISRNVARAKGE